MDEQIKQLTLRGWTLVPSVVSAEHLSRLRSELAGAYANCRAMQVENGIAENTDGTVHHLVGQGASFIELLDLLSRGRMHPLFQHYFRGNYILNSFGGVINLKARRSYVSNIHRDVRTFSGELPLMLNVLVMLDRFVPENGATFLLSGSHCQPDRPTDADFYARSERALGEAGDVLCFNSNLWHAAGENATDQERRALTLTLTPPFLKQQLDYCRTLGYAEVESLAPNLQQILGYFARTPTTLKEWYQPPERRFYRPQQG